MSCTECGMPLTWGERLIPLFQVTVDGEVEEDGYAHAYHFANEPS